MRRVADRRVYSFHLASGADDRKRNPQPGGPSTCREVRSRSNDHPGECRALSREGSRVTAGDTSSRRGVRNGSVSTTSYTRSDVPCILSRGDFRPPDSLTVYFLGDVFTTSIHALHWIQSVARAGLGRPDTPYSATQGQFQVTGLFSRRIRDGDGQVSVPRAVLDRVVSEDVYTCLVPPCRVNRRLLKYDFSSNKKSRGKDDVPSNH